MRSRLFLRFLPVALFLAVPCFSRAGVQSRINSIDSSSRVALQRTVSPRVLAGTDLGAAPADRKLTSMTLFFNRTAAQQAALDQLLIDLQNPSSPRYHQWLTPEQFGAQFGLASQDLAKVSAWLSAQGFAVMSTGRGGGFISFSGTASQIQQTFGTTLHSVLVDGEAHVGNVTDPVLPAGIAGVVAGFTGLNDLKLKSRARISRVAAPGSDASAHPQFTSSVSKLNYIAPGDFGTIYDTSPLIKNGTTGAGVTIAVAGQTDISITDVTSFRSASGLSTTNLPSVYCIQTNSAGSVLSAGIVTSPASLPSCIGTSTGDLDEAQLDVEWSGAVAPGATILYVDSKDVLNVSLVQAIDRNLGQIVSISYGLCEASAGASNLAAFNQLFQQANAQGQTITGPGGDAGATDCDYASYSATGGLAVDFPASSPNVTAVGGTMFNEGSGTYWQSASGTDVLSSALSNIPEAVWNESSATSGLGAGGGGASSYFSKPAWQTGIGVPNDSLRDVPDISLSAASGHDGYLYCVQGSCTNGFRSASSGLAVVGGTSVGAPSFAGILALIEQKIGSRVGNANPTIYGLAASQYATVFHDTITGNNSSPCIAGTPNCPSGGSIGYNATIGYDLATGWGSVDANTMATYWTSVIPAGVINATSKANAAVSVSTSTSLCALSAGSIVLNVQVSNGASAQTVPTGTVQVFIDSNAVGSPVPLVNGSASGISVNTASLSSGSHYVSVSYSGDGNFFSSKGILTAGGLQTPLDVISSTSADFSLTPCAANVTTLRGTTAAELVLTLTPFHNYSGPVTLTLDSGDAVAASYQFSNNSNTVTLNSTTAATTTLTLSAYQTNAITGTGQLKLQQKAEITRHPLGRVPWYASTSGATVACLLLVSLPRRRRMGGLLAVVLSVAAIGAVGCSSSSSTASSGTSTGTGTTTNASPGAYTLIVTATGTSGQVHTTNITFTVQ